MILQFNLQTYGDALIFNLRYLDLKLIKLSNIMRF